MFRLDPGAPVQLKDFDPRFADQHEKKKAALREIETLGHRMDELQFQLYAEQKRSLLICLQALDAGGKDGVVRHVIGSMNPQGCRVVSFKQPTPEELCTISCGESNIRLLSGAKSSFSTAHTMRTF